MGTRSTDKRYGGTVIRIWDEFQKEFKISNLSDNEAFLSFMDGFKPWAKQELQCRGVQELAKGIKVVESLIELVLRKEKSEFSKPDGKGNGGEDEE
ncbi:hypothetical protein PVK06_004639 [Gossypium arboreum]|uniref:Uncharacterized protein n=1 Tax=Gossypium arboreum TaxID=29729 RepID=A0ABR0QTH5_GOSAR|nr:hypothetical protein PVK06_004639 [Gossypium arboreum]